MSIVRTSFEYEHREVILRDRPEHMMQISPKGTVPVLLLNDGTVIEESLEIIERIYVKDGEIARVWAENDPDFHRFKKHSRWLNIFLDLDPQEGKKQDENQEA